MKELTPKQARFVEELMRDGEYNVSAAAERAGYSKKTGGHLVRRAHIAAAIEAAKAEREARTRIDADTVLKYLGDMMQADIQDITDELGRYKPITQWPKIWRQMLQGCEVAEMYARSQDGKAASWDAAGKVVKCRFIDRLKAIELIGRHINVKAFEPEGQHLHLHLDEVRARVQEARQRLIGAGNPPGDRAQARLEGETGCKALSGSDDSRTEHSNVEVLDVTDVRTVETSPEKTEELRAEEAEPRKVRWWRKTKSDARPWG